MKGEKAMYYEIYDMNGRWIVWEFSGNGFGCERVKSFKTKKGAEHWAKKQLTRITWK